MSTIRQQIVDAIEAALKTVVKDVVVQLDDGPHTYGTTIKTVSPWRKVPFAPLELPALAFRDADAEVVPAEFGRVEHQLKIDLAVFVSGKTSASVARSILADVVACIGVNRRWGGLARFSDIDSHALDLEQSGEIIAAVNVSFTVSYRTPLWRT